MMRGHEARDYLTRGEELLSKGNYEGALKETRKVFSVENNDALYDRALYNIALINTHFGNPKQDYRQAIDALTKLVESYPQSSLAREAKIWTALLEENIKLAQETQKLRDILQKSKQVDIEIDKKRRQ